jgi:hypothetical protein
MKTRRNASLTELVHDAAEALEEFARWPETESRKIAADNAVADLGAALHGYDVVVPRAIMLTLVADMLEGMFLRKCPVAGMRLAFDKMLDIFDPGKHMRPKPTSEPKDQEQVHDAAG